MTWNELLESCKTGVPRVKYGGPPIKHAESDIGIVTKINIPGLCGVHFPGMMYTVWFEDTQGADGRTHYFHQLEIINP